MSFFLVNIVDSEGNIINAANVTLEYKGNTPEAKQKSSLAKGKFNSNINCFECKVRKIGRHLLKIKKRGYESESIFVQVGFTNAKRNIRIFKKNKKSKYKIIGSPILLPISKEFINILPRKSKRSLKKRIEKCTINNIHLQKALKGEVKIKIKSHKEITSVDISQFSINDSKKIRLELSKDDEVSSSKATTVLIDDAGQQIIVLNTFFIKFFEEITLEEKKSFFNKIEIKLLRDKSSNPNAYLIEHLGNVKVDVFDFANEMLKTSLFELFDPQISVEIKHSAITPTDFLFPFHWHLFIVNLPNAWQLLKDKSVDLTYGSADVILAIHDAGILSNTTAGITNANLADFNGTVRGGLISASIGTNRKMYSFYDFRSLLTNTLGVPTGFRIMVPNNNTGEPPANPGSHGIAVAGVAGGVAGGSEGIPGNIGIVGAAPNVRLIGSQWGASPTGTTNLTTFIDGMEWLAGIDPQWWADGNNYSPGPVQTFPALFNTPNNSGPGASISNHSHTWPLNLTSGGFEDLAIERITSNGRNKRGTAIFFATGNFDCDFGIRNLATDGGPISLGIGVHEKVFTVAGSTISPNGEEVRASYSNWGSGPNPTFPNNYNRGVDFCAPTASYLVSGNPAVFAGAVDHFPPNTYGITTASVSGQGNIPTSNLSQTTLNAINNSTQIQIAVGGGAFVVGNAILIDTSNPSLTEAARITGVGGVGGNTLTLSHNLKRTHAAGVTVIGGLANAQDSFSGTSSSTPLVSGIAALVLSANPNLTFLELRDVLRLTAEPIDFRANGQYFAWRDQTGANILDANDLMIPVAPAVRTTVNGTFNAGATSVVLNSVAGFTVGQVILFGAETTLSINTAAGGNSLTVPSTTNFQPNMNIVVGGGPRAVLAGAIATPLTTRSILVSNTTGFRIGQQIRIGTPANQEVQTISGIGSNTIDPITGNGYNLPTQRILFAANLNNPHNRYEPVVLANSENHVLQPGPIAAGTLSLNSNLANAHNPVGTPRVWIHSQNAEIRRIKTIDSSTNTIIIDPLINQQINSPVTGGLTPFYSNALGFGRINAEDAVILALNYNHNQRDLVIRNDIDDNGLTSTDVESKIDSPDIWVRNSAIALPLGAPNIPANYGISGSIVHQKPRRGGNRTVLIRVGNIGSLPSFDFVLNSYISLTDTEVDTPLKKKDYEELSLQPLNPASPTTIPPSYQLSSGITGTFSLGTSQSTKSTHTAPRSAPANPVVQPGPYLPNIAGGSTYTGVVRWNQADRPALPLTFASVMLMNTIVNGQTAIQVNHTRGYKTGQTILVGIPSTPNHFAATVQKVSDQIITITTPVAGIITPFITPSTPPINHGLIIPTGIRVMRLDNLNATQVNAIIPATPPPGSTTAVEVASADHLMPGQYILIGPPGNATSEISQIASIAYNNSGNDILTLVTPIKNARSLGDAVSRIEGKLSTFILAEVTPHDGLLAGDTPYDNNNMSCKEIYLGHKISFLNDTNVALNKELQVDTAGTTITVNFRIRIEDPELFTTETMQFTAYRLGTNDDMETITFAHDGTNWVESAGAWLTIYDPVIAIGGAAAVGPNMPDAWFTGTFDVNNAHQDIRLVVSVPDSGVTFRTIESFKINVATVTPPTGGSGAIANSSGQVKIGGTQKMHCFADLQNVTQTANQGFGAIDTNRFRVSSMFSTPAAAGSAVMAYAVLDGLVFVQENPVNNTINLIIQPLKQAEINFTKVKYYIYRGLQKADFIDAGTPVNVRAATGNPDANFIDYLHQTNQSLNPGSNLTLEALNWDNKQEEEFLDNYFFSAGANSQLPVVSRGMELGKFHNALAADEFGFEIVLAEGYHSLTIKDAQASSKIIDVSGITDIHEKRARQEEILNYVDPAAYFGMHFYSKFLYPSIPDPDPNAINTVRYSGDEIYTHIVSKFFTRNTVYVDIRNEHGYSYNYDNTYTISSASADDGHDIRIGSAPSSGSNTLTSQIYEHQGWPLIIKDNQSTPIQSDQDTSSIYLNLAWNDHNSNPHLYIERGFILTPFTRNRFVSNSNLLDVETVVSIDEATSTFTIDAVLTSEISAGDIISIIDNDFLSTNRIYRVVNAVANATDGSHTDIQVDAGTIPTGAQAASTKGKMAYRKWTKDIGLSIPLQSNGTAGQRVHVAGVVKLRYYRRLSPNVRSITAINQASKQFTVAGDIVSKLSVGNIFIVRGSIPASGNHNDGEYTVSASPASVTFTGGNTRITVNETIPDATANGEVYISDQQKIKTAHYHDNIFGSLNALNRLIPIDSMSTVSLTQTKITVKGDFLSTVDLNTSLSILKSNITTNNQDGLNIVTKVVNSGNTEITVQHASGALTNDTTGFIQLIYSVWKSAAPTRWLGGFDKRFIDAKNSPLDSSGNPQIGFSYVAQTGIALETDGVIFYATPLDFFEAPGNTRVPNSISINGGTSTDDSFWKAMQHQNQRLKLNMTLLRIGTTEVPVYDFVDYPSDSQHEALKENFLALCLTKTELSQLTISANQNLTDLHDQYLVLRKEITATDDNGEVYKRYEVRVNGWAKVGTNLVEREIAPASPIFVYTHGDDGVVFASQNYPNLGVLLSSNANDYEEELRLRSDALDIFNNAGAVQVLVNNFVNAINAISNDYPVIRTTINAAADQLWALASSTNAVQDDRTFYWARLHMRVAIRNHAYLKHQTGRMYDMFSELQDRSRGISSIDFSGAAATDKKILLIAFDPFGLDTSIHEDYNIKKSSPAAASALSLHGQTVSQGGVNGFVQSVIFPVRYRTIQRKDLEKIVLPYLTGADQVDMICTINDNRVGRYDIERFASRERKETHVDNNNRNGSRGLRYYKARSDASMTPPFKLIRRSEAVMAKFLETTLPIANLIPGTLGNNLVIYNQQFETTDPVSTNPISNSGSGSGNIAGPNNTSSPSLGSSGDFIFNEAFYRVAAIRENVVSTTKTGHISVERIQEAGDDFDLAKTQSVNNNLTTIIKDSLAGI